jgi:GxxExxY protein
MKIAMAYELQQRGLRVARQVPVTIRYKEISFDAAFRADLLVGKRDRGAEVR